MSAIGSVIGYSLKYRFDFLLPDVIYNIFFKSPILDFGLSILDLILKSKFQNPKCYFTSLI